VWTYREGRFAVKVSCPSDADLRLVCDSIPHIAWVATPDGSTEYFNRQGTDYIGLPESADSGWTSINSSATGPRASSWPGRCPQPT
jgi:PAS domain-containing protein